MVRHPHSLKIRLELWLLQAVQALIARLPLGWVTLPGALLGRLGYYVVPRSRQAALRNLEIALGDTLTPAQRRHLLREVYRFFGAVVCEVLAMPRLTGALLERHVALDNPQVLREALAGGRGAVLVSGHLGNWELMGGAISRSGLVLSMYVGAQRNPLVDEVINGIRRAMGTQTVGKGVAMRGLLRAMRDNRIVAMLADQHYSKKRHYVAFFGQPVSMVPGPASLALRTGAPVIFGQCLREGPLRYRARFRRIEPPAPSGNGERDVLAYSQAIADVLAEAVRAHPAQYFWMHRRFRPIPARVVLSDTNRAFLAGRLTVPLPDPVQPPAAGTTDPPSPPVDDATLERAG
ncbi:MAG: lysophospholipid acyltransferase family protein [Candidatus Lambdaproteobacteria bacterium]|nr:lysophospholipid acyltransferase family protein [Candidatus Lambdaproteobacteria bacterium]